MEYIEYTLAEISKVAENILEVVNFNQNNIISFQGSLGAGKTTLIKELIKQLGVQEIVKSPTYSIQCEYEGAYKDSPLEIFHWDLYRISDEEAEEMLRDFLSDKSIHIRILFVEWGERLSSFYEYLTIFKIMEIESNQTSEGKNKSVKTLEMRKIHIKWAEKAS